VLTSNVAVDALGKV